MSDLKVKLGIKSNAVYMEVLEQNEFLRENIYFIGSNKMSLCSEDKPELREDEVYVRGTSREYDNYVSSLYFDTNAEANIYFDKVKRLIKEFNDDRERYNVWNKEVYTEIVE